jgi:hypothetical protein
MPRPRKFVPLHFLPYKQARRSKAPAGTLWIDISSYADEPYNQLSPFFAHGAIPIPGMPGQSSDSVEGIWQGLKVIRGKTAPRYFDGWGKKRGGKPSGHKFGNENRLLRLEAARRRIYLPAYEWMLDHRVDQELLQEIMTRAFRGIPQYFCDRENNGSISKDLPLAHASVFVHSMNRKCQDQWQ